MTHLPPYSLRPESRNSDPYYTAIAALADQWLVYARRAAGDLIDDFRTFQANGGRSPRTFAEDAFELLVLGVLLKEHGRQAERLPAWAAELLAKLVEWQARWPGLEGAIKTIRGLFGGLAGDHRDDYGEADSRPPARWALDYLRRWLRAHDQATQAERLAAWQDYFAHVGPLQAQEALRQSQRLADAFARQSEAALGPYTTGVEPYRQAMAGQVRFRYDAALILRSRLEYHLGMLGTELLNRAYRARFLGASVKIVIAPPCLRACSDAGASGVRCQAIQTPLGAKCQGCRPECRLHQLTRLGEKSGFAVYSIPDDELQKVCQASGRAGGNVGVVGLSCALTNWNAGWEAERLGLPAQGLLLDHAGCQKHWLQPGLPTDTNFKQLKALMGLPESSAVGQN